MDPVIGVVVADDHPVVREGIVRLLQRCTDLQVLGEAGDGVTALDLIRTQRPRVAVVDHAMPGLDGAELARVVQDERLTTRVLVLSGHTNPSIIARARDRGAAGFMSKEAERGEIQQAVRDVAAGRQVWPPNRDPDRDEASTPAPAPVALSPREYEVLQNLARGWSVPRMATQMFVAPSTAKTHVERLYDKLGVNNRGAAVAEAMRRGLLT